MRAPAPTARVDSRARFTVRGWCFLAAAVLSLAAATWLGRKDVLALSLFLGAVPLLSALAMWLVTPRVLLKRSVDPPLVPLGDAAQVALRVRRRPAFGRSRPAGATSAERAAVDVHETVDPLLGRDQDVSVPVSGVPVTYTVRPRRRGIHELGPATVRVSDPFGVVTELLDVAEHTSLHVAPDPQELTEQPVVLHRESGRDPSRRAQPQPGPDNVSTREYRHGDPMRRVHWAASARHDRLMVRQEDPRSTRRTVLVLDGVDQHWPGERVWAGVLASTHEFEWAVGAAVSVVEHLTRRETVVYALDDQGRALPRGDAEPAELRDTAVGDAAATEVVHGLARVALTARPEPEVASDPLTARLEREGLFHPVLLLTGALPAAAARRYVQTFTGSASCAVVMVVHAPLARPEAADVFDAAGWSVVLVSRWTDVDAAWLAVTTGGSLMAPPPPEPGTPQLSMDDVMGRTRRRTTA
ncbi:DUF58 domain-containing protein [Kocuria sp.]|uniref:DUF58 domain-containing protein n=1 Tax=Kocuria sp. TaxID=1871328 RepID=UPI0026DA991D|nr:DUF58 domain-containing protein [Kocuria sp.]MDO4919621.1 DUF58 domain-containing protein [Kocuria sp.]